MIFPSNIDDFPSFPKHLLFWDFPAFQVGAWAWTAPPTEPCCWICWYITIGRKDLSLFGDMYFSIKMCFYTTELLHRFLDFAVGCCLSRRCHDRSPQPGISIMLAPGGPETDSRTHVQRDYSVMVSIKSGSSPILVYGHMANMCI